MLKKLIAQAVQGKIGTSRVVEKIQESYDYVIVGAGAAGNVLAARLTEDPGTQVLLVEAGEDDAKNPNVHMPVSSAALQSTTFNWNYKSQPQTNVSQDFKGQQVSYPRGRGLGGSSSINFMLYNRGSRYDYDEWAAMGCTGWSYMDVLPYFMKAEDNTNKNYLKTGYHGQGGPMKIRDLTMTPLVNMFLQSASELGYPVGIHASPNNIGFANGQGNIHEGIRWSTAHGYLRPAMERENLHVAIGAQVQRVKIANNEATGLDLTHNGHPINVQARKEVIICAGAIESPKILMLSGIGPADHLTDLNIPVVADLPVGQNMQDHPMCVVEYKLARPVGVNVDNSYDDANRVAKEYMQYLFFTKGYLGIPISQAAVGFLRSAVAPPNTLYPDIQIQMASALAAGLLRKTWNLAEEEKDLADPEGGKPGIILSSYVLHPESTGSIKLRKRSAGAKPLIDPNFFDCENDIKTQLEGMTTILSLGKTEAFRTLGAHLAGGLEKVDENNQDQLEDFVRRRTMTSHHLTSTCKMGGRSDPTAVVDPELRVRGIKGLRVVDASVMPKIISGATSAPTIMIAEKTADLIRGTNSVSKIQLPPEIQEESEREQAVAS